MKVKKALALVASIICISMLAAGMTACGGNTKKTYAAATEFDEVDTASESSLNLVMTQSVSKIETTLSVEKDEYTLTKKVYTGKIPESEKADKVNKDLWYTEYSMYAEYVFTGKCTASGNDFTLEVPSKATRLAYYQMDVSKIYQKRFPFPATIVLPDSRDWSGLAEKAVVTIEPDAWEMAYFGGLYIQKDTECKRQTVKVDGEKIVSVTPDSSATAVVLKPRPGTTPAPEPTPGEDENVLLTLQRNGADCKLILKKEGKFTFDYKGMVKEDGTYFYEDGKLTMTAKTGATCTVTEDGDNFTINYVAAANAQLKDTFTVTKAQLNEKLGGGDRKKLELPYTLDKYDGGQAQLTLKADGKFEFTISAMGQNIKEEGAYAYTNGTLSFTPMDGATCTVTTEGENLVIEYVAKTGSGRLKDKFVISSENLKTLLG